MEFARWLERKPTERPQGSSSKPQAARWLMALVESFLPADYSSVGVGELVQGRLR